MKQQTRLAEQRLELQREDLNQTKKMVQEHQKKMEMMDQSINRHQAGFETLFQQMKKFDEKLDRELAKLRKEE